MVAAKFPFLMTTSPPWLLPAGTWRPARAGKPGCASTGKSARPANIFRCTRKNWNSASHPMKAFVTGATGFVGSHVARYLAGQGAELRLLVRPTSLTANLEGIAAERVTGDLREAEALRKAMVGCEAVFHVAADYRLWTREPHEMYRSNVAGTRNTLQLAQHS